MQFSDNNVLIVGGVLLVHPSPCAVTIARCPMLRLVFTLFFCAVPLAAQTMPPEADKQLAHDLLDFPTRTSLWAEQIQTRRISWSAITERAAASRSCFSPTPMLWKPSAKIGAWTRFS